MLSVKKLTKSFQDKIILHSISLTLKKGEILGLVGESGSGKTTLLNLIAGLLEPDSGSISLKNEKVLPPSLQLIAGHPKIKIVQQDFQLFPNISVEENIAYSIRFYEKKYQQQRTNELIAICNLENVRNHYPRELSGGEKQRASIAKALADEPLLLLLDEPFSQLDIFNKEKLKSEILHIVKTLKIGCIFVSHDISDSFSLADKIAVIQHGEIIQTDTPENVYQKPLNEYIAGFTGIASLFQTDALKKEFQNNTNFNAQSPLTSLSGTVLIRPENVTVSDETSAVFQGKISRISFAGSYYLVEVKISSKMILKIHLYHKPLLNQDVFLQIKWDQVWFF